MSCTVCHRGGCTSSFHSFEEQEAAERGGALRCDKGHRQLWLGESWEACRTCAREAGEHKRSDSKEE